MSAERYLQLLLCISILVATACGGDSSEGDASLNDGGSSDGAAGDAANDAAFGDGGDAGQGDASLPRAFSVCDPYAPLACELSEKCQVVLDPLVGSGVDLYFGCVPRSTGEVGARLPCASSISLPSPPASDEVTHSCDEGALCVQDGLLTCRPLCGREGLSCMRSSELCVFVTRNPDVAACLTASDCDPVAQEDCAAGEGCYLRQNGVGDWIGDCAATVNDPVSGAPLEEGDSCTFFDQCEAGTGCLPGLDGAGDFVGASLCRRYCDAGAASDPCVGAPTCRALPLTSGAVFHTPQAPGACYL